MFRIAMKCKVCGENCIEVQRLVYKCGQCSHTYINYQEDGILYHKTEYRLNKFGTRDSLEIKDGIFTSVFHQNRKSICKNRVDILQPYISECDSIFDVGSGGGTFLLELQNLIKEVHCQEISDICITNLKLLGFNPYTQEITKLNINRTYDIVTCWHVLEHVLNLNEFAASLARLSKKYLIIEVPIDRKINYPNAPWDGHYHYFSKQSLGLLFKNDYTILSITEGIQKPSLLGIFQKNKQ